MHFHFSRAGLLHKSGVFACKSFHRLSVQYLFLPSIKKSTCLIPSRPLLKIHTGQKVCLFSATIISKYLCDYNDPVVIDYIRQLLLKRAQFTCIYNACKSKITYKFDSPLESLKCQLMVFASYENLNLEILSPRV